MEKLSSLFSLHSTYQQLIKKLSKQVISGHPTLSLEEVASKLQAAMLELEIIKDQLAGWKEKLGYAEWSSLKSVMKSDWSELRIRALVAKNELQNLLRAQKYELERTVRALTVTKNQANSGIFY
jgi:hypothetical protein